MESGNDNRPLARVLTALAIALILFAAVATMVGIHRSSQRRSIGAQESSPAEQAAAPSSAREGKDAAAAVPPQEAQQDSPAPMEEPVAPTPAPAAAAAATAAGGWTVPEAGVELVRIEPGTFVMGTATNDPYRNRSEEMGDGPPTTVTLTRPYWIARTETTVAQYEAVMGTNSPPRAAFPKDSPNATADVARLPAVNVTWDQAMEFCAKLTERTRATGRLKPGFVFTLPSEAQWEFAARAGTRTRHYAGDATDRLYDIAWFVKTVAPFTRKSGPLFRPVAAKKPNAWQLHDMLGNVREWCRDWYAPLPGGVVKDWTGPASPCKVRNEERPVRVCKGGCWLDGQRQVSCGARDWHAPGYGGNPGFREGTVGFRVAAVAAEEIAP